MPPIIFSLIFLALLELSVSIAESYFWLFALGALLVSLAGAWRADRKAAVLVIAFFISLLSVLFLDISRNFIFHQAVIITAALMLYAVFAAYIQRKLTFIVFSSFAVFMAGTFLMLIYQMTSAISWWIVAPFIFLLSFFLFFSTIRLLIGDDARFLLRLFCFSLAAGFIIAEFYFALSALPFNLISIDFLIFIIYYGLWNLSSRYFSERLTKKSLLLDASVVLISFAAVFLSAKWFP